MLYRSNIKKTKIYLGLLKRFTKELDFIKPINSVTYNYRFKMQFVTFNKTYISNLNLIYIYEFIHKNMLCIGVHNLFFIHMIYFYAKLSKANKYTSNISIGSNLFYTYTNNNIIIFSKPHSQLFLNIFKERPVFIFTSGLMRIVLNEKRKSSKKNYKVAISLIKLATILLNKKNFFENCYLKLNNLGQLKSKILTTLLKAKSYKFINYVLIKFHFDTTSQKFNTRRSIKKYVKKRFKLST